MISACWLSFTGKLLLRREVQQIAYYNLWEHFCPIDKRSVWCVPLFLFHSFLSTPPTPSENKPSPKEQFSK